MLALTLPIAKSCGRLQGSVTLDILYPWSGGTCLSLPTREVGAGESEIQGQLRLYREFQTTQFTRIPV